jgi:hypothetical protein
MMMIVAQFIVFSWFIACDSVRTQIQTKQTTKVAALEMFVIQTTT